MQVVIKENSLFIKDLVENKVVLEGELFHQIRTDESVWTIEDENMLVLVLEKFEENVWNTVIKGDKEIDPKKVDNAKNLEEFDPETQGAL